MPLGIYISVPFCRSKCTYCNFASGVFSSARMSAYLERLNQDIAAFPALAVHNGAVPDRTCDSIYLGGGTPSLLQPEQLKKLFFILRSHFEVSPRAEVTVECAPGTLSDEFIATLIECGANRVSLGMQSFVDKEAASVARLHKREQTLADIDRLRRAGISNINLDLIAGLPHQTRASWEYSLDQVVATGVPHVSVYILEIDEDSRLGSELIAGGAKYHAHFVPDEDLTAQFYEIACWRLHEAGIEQYEISNFARPRFASQHNLKYWTRQPYLGFGVDAHSMLPASPDLRIDGIDALRFATTDSFDSFFISAECATSAVSTCKALEERFFLGLRLNEGVSLEQLRADFGQLVNEYDAMIENLVASELLSRAGDNLQLTSRGRLLSNEVFQQFIAIVEDRSAAVPAGPG